MQSGRYAASVVFDTDAAVGALSDYDMGAIAAKSFVGGIVDHLLHDVQWVFGAGIHARTLPDRLQSLENTNRCFAID